MRHKLVSILLAFLPVLCIAQNTLSDLYLLHMEEAARLKGSNVKHEKNLLLGCYYLAYSALDTPEMEKYPDTKDKKVEFLKLAHHCIQVVIMVVCVLCPRNVMDIK